MVGYWNKSDYTKETIVNGWLHKGDMGYYDEKGYMYIVDRKKDIIISGGENAYPEEVEEILNQQPSVMEAAIIGVPDEKWIERVHAVIVLKKNAKVTANEIIPTLTKSIKNYPDFSAKPSKFNTRGFYFFIL